MSADDRQGVEAMVVANRVLAGSSGRYTTSSEDCFEGSDMGGFLVADLEHALSDLNREIPQVSKGVTL